MLLTANYFLNDSHRNEKYFDSGIEFKPVKVWVCGLRKSRVTALILILNIRISDFKIFLILLG